MIIDNRYFKEFCLLIIIYQARIWAICRTIFYVRVFSVFFKVTNFIDYQIRIKHTYITSSLWNILIDNFETTNNFVFHAVIFQSTNQIHSKTI